MSKKKTCLLENELKHLAVAKNYESKQEFTSQFLQETINDIILANQQAESRCQVIQDNNLLLRRTNLNLSYQLDKYQQLAGHLERKVSIAKENSRFGPEDNSTSGKSILNELERLRQAELTEKRLVNEIRMENESLLLLKAQNDKLKSEIQISEMKLAETASIIAIFDQKGDKLNEGKGQIDHEIARIEGRVSDLRGQNEFLKNEINVLIQDLNHKEFSKDNLVKQKLHLEALARDLSTMRIDGSEKINEKVFAKNQLIRKIIEDNGRLDALTTDVDRTLQTLKNLI